MQFDPFVLPFAIGLILLLCTLVWKFTSWIMLLEPGQKTIVRKNIISFRTWKGVREIMLESLLHHRIFRKNRLLGYMHMSLAFGWFLLIIAGHFETASYFGRGWRAPYVPIFLRFAQDTPGYSLSEKTYWFVMDALLLFILSGVALAWFKRLRSRAFGMRSTTQHPMGDRIALSALWFIFPLRLLAESITSAYYGGGSFLTGSIGNLISGNMITYPVFLTSWWLYSFSLGMFFIALPFSRYMHIPDEVVLILLRNWGVKASKEKRCGMAQFEINACSSCGICLDECQLNATLNYRNHQSPYIFRAIRNEKPCTDDLFNCLMCGRCEQSCPVGIETTTIRVAERTAVVNNLDADFSYLPKQKLPVTTKADILYFGGCMSHLTPSIKRSMYRIFEAAGISYANLDEHESICCGRPMMLAGMKEQAGEMIRRNKAIIEQFGAKILVTSCPICFHVFREEYNLNIEVLHHTQYIDYLIASKKLELTATNKHMVYHDPCELGRGSDIYEEPRRVIRQLGRLEEQADIRSESLCCGGSLANTVLTSGEQKQLATETINRLITRDTEAIITSCPLCKKTFAKAKSNYEILDIAEMVASQLVEKQAEERISKEVFQEAHF
jgi:Fe-S oxidoreductase